MNKNRNYLRTFAITLLAFIVACSFSITTVSAAGSKKAKVKKSTVYDEVIKSGNTVYCACDGIIAKVNLKTGKVKVLSNTPYWFYTCMKKKGKYIYAISNCDAYSELHRINTSKKKRKVIAGNRRLASGIECYTISKKKIYYKYYYNDDNDREFTVNKVMKLNGKGKKKTKVQAKNKRKRSNAKGYYTRSVSCGDICEGDLHYKAYLVTPKKTYYLGKSEWS